MNEYLLEYFRYNDYANRVLLETIFALPDRTEALQLFSHLISSQNKWYNRITQELPDDYMNWFEDPIGAETMLNAWNESFGKWVVLLQKSTDEALEEYIIFERQVDKIKMKVKLRDIVFQLNCHSIHHRAQINKLVSNQGLTVPSTDYIRTVVSRVDE